MAERNDHFVRIVECRAHAYVAREVSRVSGFMRESTPHSNPPAKKANPTKEVVCR